MALIKKADVDSEDKIWWKIEARGNGVGKQTQRKRCTWDELQEFGADLKECGYSSVTWTRIGTRHKGFI